MTDSMESNPSAELRRRIFRIERLGAMPQVVWEILGAMSSDTGSAADLANLIEKDPALTSKVLRLANSVYYAPTETVTTVNRAIVTIGLQELEILILGAGFAEVFDLNSVAPGSMREALWHHCLAVSWLAGELADRAGGRESATVMVGGLLHDLGKLVIASHLNDQLELLNERMEAGTPFYEAEEELGVKHTIIGSWLARRWRLPDIHMAAIRDHHSPDPTDPYYRSTCLIFLANRLAKRMGIGLVQKARYLDPRKAINFLKLSQNDLKEVGENSRDKVETMIGKWRSMHGPGRYV